MPDLLQGEPAPLAKAFGVQRADNFAPTKLRPLHEITRLRGPAKPSDLGRAQIALQVGSMGLNVAMNMSFLASFMNLGGPDLLVILVIILVLFGAKKLPELARGLGQAIKEFQKAKDEFTDELHKAGHSDDAAKGSPPPASTVARTDAPASSAVRPDPNQGATPGGKADQV